MQHLVHYPAKQFAIFRIIFGTYLFYYAYRVYPYLTELYSTQGLLVDRSVNLTYGVFPSWLYDLATPTLINGLGIAALLGCAAIITGFYRPIAAAIVFGIYWYFFNLNSLTLTPETAFVNWLLLALAIIPTGEPWSISKINHSWVMPTSVVVGMWLIMGGEFLYAGTMKLTSDLWWNGEALEMLIKYTDLQVIWAKPVVDLIPSPVFKVLTWVSIFLQMFFFFAMFHKKTRPVGWLLLTGMWIGNFPFIALDQILFGTLCAHLFVFDTRWIPRRSAEKMQAELEGHLVAS